MCSREVMTEKIKLKYIGVLLMMVEDEVDPEEREELCFVTNLLMVSMVEGRVDRTMVRDVRTEDLMIGHIREDESWNNYRFRKEDLTRLYNVLQIPDPFYLKNRSRFSGETAFLIVLRRLR